MVLISLLLASIILLNFYSPTVLEYFSFLPPYAILAFSLVISLFIIIFFWYRESENEKLKSEFITIITHKFRTPLTGIKWAVETLTKDSSTFQQKDDMLKEISRSTQRLMEIVDLMSNFVKFENKFEFAYEATSVREMINDSLQKYAEIIRNKKISFTINADPATPLIIIDKVKIQFVLDMLVDNAIKYTKEGGGVGILLKNNKDSISLVVEDNGIGVGFSEKRHIFTKFFRGKDAKIMDTEGMGVALYTAKKIIQRHRGRIWFESDGKDKGAAFFVEIPKSR